MELLDGHLYLHLDLGSGPLKIRASRKELNDGSWHRVELNIKRRRGNIAIDGDVETFETLGKS